MNTTRLMMSDVVEIGGEDYFVAEINTKGKREFIDFSLVKPGVATDENPKNLCFQFNRNNGILSGKYSENVMFCETRNEWRLVCHSKI